MGLVEILAIVILLLVLVAVALLILLLRRASARAHVASPEDLAATAERMRREIAEPILRAEREGQVALRAELQSELRASRAETSGTVQTAMERLGNSLRETQRETAGLQSQRITELTEAERKLMAELAEAQSRRFEAQDRQLEAMQKTLGAILSERMEGLNTSVSRRLEEVDKQFREFREQSAAAQEQMRRTMEERLTTLQARNAEQLEQMRVTVDEKLQKTLDERIAKSFQMVNERLGEVHKGLGEMQALAGDVGDLKKVMAGVKTRGILGEIQLGAIMEEILAPEQYETNAVTKPGTANRVEFAVRLPGEGDQSVYLPVDAKFPADAYHHVVDAYEAGDSDRIKTALSELEIRLKGCAKDIRDKYIAPPYTTTFGILFLPFEGLYAEVVRQGLADTLRRQYDVSVAGPTTLAALLNSLQMGFRTLAIQRRSGEVWEVLGAVKTEFATFERVLAKAKERIDQTGDELDKLIGTRTRQINRKLRSVAELPSAEAQKLIDTTTVLEDEG